MKHRKLWGRLGMKILKRERIPLRAALLWGWKYQAKNTTLWVKLTYTIENQKPLSSEKQE